MKTVNLTPVGFTGKNAEVNAARANLAADKLIDANRIKAELLRTLVEDYFGGATVLRKAIVKALKDNEDDNAEANATEFVEAYERANESHSQ
jgi:hypothetical protein